MSGAESGLILVAGEALIDLVPGDGFSLTAHTGGGPFNTARTIARLGQSTALVGSLSTDRFGERLFSELSEDGVITDALVRTDEPTTLALAEVDDAGSSVYRFYAQGTSALSLRSTADVFRILPQAVHTLHVGSLGIAVEPMAAALEGLVCDAGDVPLVMVDPNCRPWAVQDEISYRARLDRLFTRADVIKASKDDLSWIVPDVPALDAARQLLDAGPSVVLLTLGEEGVAIVTHEGTQTVQAPRVRIIDTIGAGDAFGGAFLAWWARLGLGREELCDGGLLRSAAGFACEVAALTCGRPGAHPPLLAELGRRAETSSASA